MPSTITPVSEPVRGPRRGTRGDDRAATQEPADPGAGHARPPGSLVRRPARARLLQEPAALGVLELSLRLHLGIDLHGVKSEHLDLSFRPALRHLAVPLRPRDIRTLSA